MEGRRGIFFVGFGIARWPHHPYAGMEWYVPEFSEFSEARPKDQQADPNRIQQADPNRPGSIPSTATPRLLAELGNRGTFVLTTW